MNHFRALNIGICSTPLCTSMSTHSCLNKQNHAFEFTGGTGNYGLGMGNASRSTRLGGVWHLSFVDGAKVAYDAEIIH